jgi:hypothetical protein
MSLASARGILWIPRASRRVQYAGTSEPHLPLVKGRHWAIGRRRPPQFTLPLRREAALTEWPPS